MSDTESLEHLKFDNVRDERRAPSSKPDHTPVEAKGPRRSLIPVLLLQLLAAAVVTLPLAGWEVEAVVWHPQLIGAMAWSVLGMTLGGSSLLYLLIQRGAAATVSSLMYLVPPCAALMAWVLFDEPITLATLAGIALTALGVSLVVRAPVVARATSQTVK